ncbi:hypothetical protein B6U98_02625 [Thermoplasmatales archaeon ex4572_165]|nr:MAG: hypothetical protein B6U98_02625 [Thermoplasmatales archaeon ex4572_165]
MNNSDETISFPEPLKVQIEKPSLKKYIKYLSFFGPGAIVASLTVGQGQLILGPQIGALFGFSFLWLITINLGSYLIAYVSCRFTMLSGISIIDLFAFKTRKGWFNWLIIIIMLIFIPIFAASIITSLGQALSWIFGFGHYLWWGIGCSFIAALLVLVGRYRLLEYTQAVFVAVLAIGAVVSVLFIQPDYAEIIPHFFKIGLEVPNEYPTWVSQVEGFSPTPIPLLMLGFLGTLTFTLITLVGYLGWIKQKKWGIFRNETNSQEYSSKLFSSFKKHGKITYLPNDPSEIKKSKMLLTPLKIDLVFAFIIVAIVSASYIIAGNYLLGPQTDGSVLLPSDTELIRTQGEIFKSIASWLLPLFKLGVFFALFGTIYAGLEAGTRMLYELFQTLDKRVKTFEYKRFMLYTILYIMVLGIPLSILMYKGLSVLLMLSITLMFIGVFGVIIYGISAIYMSQKVLPKQYRLSPLNLLIAIVGVILLCIPLLFLIL